MDRLTRRVIVTIAHAFGLDELREPPVLIQHTSFPAWRFTDVMGRRILVKRLWAGADPDWWHARRNGMFFEARAIAAGVDAATPVPPIRPAFCYAVRIESAGVFRAYDWVAHRPLTDMDDISAWLGATMATLHRLESVSDVTEPQWWGLEPEWRWLEWLEAAETRGAAWAEQLRTILPDLLRLSERLRAAWFAAGDHVITHGDLEPYNVLMTPDGPVLIDWDSVGVESATLEVGRAAVTFGRSLAGIVAVLRSYLDAGGALAPLGHDLLLRPIALDLGHLTERITAALALAPAPGWLHLATVDGDIERQLSEILVRTEDLRRQAELVAATIGFD